MRVIRFKSYAQVDNFVYCFGIHDIVPANVFFAFFSISLLEAINCFKDDPDGFIKLLAKGIIGQSAYLMNLILATGQETMLQLLQWRSLIKQAVIRPLINLNARSRRYREWLNEAPQFEQSFIFGEEILYRAKFILYPYSY